MGRAYARPTHEGVRLDVLDFQNIRAAHAQVQNHATFSLRTREVLGKRVSVAHASLEVSNNGGFGSWFVVFHNVNIMRDVWMTYKTFLRDS